MKIGKRTWRLDSDRAEILLRPRTGKSLDLEGLGSISRDFGLWILAEDAVCSELDDLAYELVPGSRKKEYVLRVQATDCVGNKRTGQLVLGKKR